jgi:hypothetical protein
MHQPAWSLFDAIKLAGVEPTAGGYTIDPRLPMPDFELRLPNVAVAYARGRVSGSVTATGAGTLRMRVAGAPDGGVVRVNGRRVASARDGRFTTFALEARAGRAARWKIS